MREKENEILTAIETHLEHAFLAGSYFRDRSPRFVFFSFSLRLSSIRDDMKLIGEERDHFCNNTPVDVSGCIENITRNRNKIAGPNTFAMEDFFLKHDDNDRRKRSTLSKYCEGADTFSYYSYSIYSG